MYICYVGVGNLILDLLFFFLAICNNNHDKQCQDLFIYFIIFYKAEIMGI